MVGDSTAYVIGWALVRSNDDGLLSPEVLFKTSSGLARPDFFDWPFYLSWVIENRPPELMLLSLGANDHQPLVGPEGGVHQVGTDGWRAEYRRRVENVTRMITARGTRLYWIGQPLSRDPEYTEAMRGINRVYAQVAEEHEDVEFIDIWPWISDDGRYTDTLPGPDGKPVQIRQSDGIHLTDEGGDVAARHVWELLADDWGG